MRCRACNKDHEPHQLWRSVEGLPELIMEDLCSECLYWARAATYDGGPEGELEYLTITLGLNYGRYQDSEE